jgi:hypothetical protein
MEVYKFSISVEIVFSAFIKHLFHTIHVHFVPYDIPFSFTANINKYVHMRACVCERDTLGSANMTALPTSFKKYVNQDSNLIS